MDTSHIPPAQPDTASLCREQMIAMLNKPVSEKTMQLMPSLFSRHHDLLKALADSDKGVAL